MENVKIWIDGNYIFLKECEPPVVEEPITDEVPETEVVDDGKTTEVEKVEEKPKVNPSNMIYQGIAKHVLVLIDKHQSDKEGEVEEFKITNLYKNHNHSNPETLTLKIGQIATKDNAKMSAEEWKQFYTHNTGR